jgi:tetratricopeptide (TPR) repeat protein
MRITILFFAFLSALLASTPAERRIEQAEAAIGRAPDNARFHADLALAYARRARETADMDYYAKAHATLDRALAIAPEDFNALKVRAWALLGQHKFKKGLELAKQLNKRAPDDVIVYGFMVDANVELGNYDDAVDAAQWMLDLQTGNVPALTRAAYLRELYGFIDGAVDFMQMAFDRTPQNESEDRAWIQTQIAHLELSRGRLDRAELSVNRALQLYPDYHYALAQLGALRLAQQRPQEAVEAFQKRYEGAAHPENLLDIAKAQRAAGNGEEADALFAKFEKAALAESENNDNCNRDLTFYYADIANNPAEALRIAALEHARRDDIHTRHAYAWALFRAGETEQAAAAMERALSTGLRNAEAFYHAGVIAKARGDEGRASKMLRDSLELNPTSSVASEVAGVLPAPVLQDSSNAETEPRP